MPTQQQERMSQFLNAAAPDATEEEKALRRNVALLASENDAYPDMVLELVQDPDYASLTNQQIAAARLIAREAPDGDAFPASVNTLKALADETHALPVVNQSGAHSEEEHTAFLVLLYRRHEQDQPPNTSI